MQPSTPAAAVSETHTATVFFVADRAYKLKKPVDLGFLDFTTRQARQRTCLREVELNRRFSPDVYLGVADVHDTSGDLCDHLVVMRRMPDDRRLSALVRAHAPLAFDALRSVARQLAAWHSIAPRGAQIDLSGSRDALRARWAASFDQVRPFHGQVIDGALATEIQDRTYRFLGRRKALFDARIKDGRVVDGHGDLLATDIFCLDDGPRILDCLEFDDHLRWLDGLDDAAFLAMDLERLGATGPAEQFMHWYAEYAADPAPPALRHHYVAYRAFVRAKVACFRHAQGDPHAATEAELLAKVTLRHLQAGSVGLILTGGLPGTGKSTLAGALADRLGCTLLSSDRIRKEIAGITPEESAAAPYRSGLYGPAWTERTYTELLDRAARLLELGETVILDASWTAQEHRDRAAALAADADAEFFPLWCQAPANVTTHRLANRLHGTSDADAAIAAAMATETSAWPQASRIDTSGPLEKTIDTALAIVRPYGAEHVWPRRSQIPPD